jgi:hypothetical protein
LVGPAFPKSPDFRPLSVRIPAPPLLAFPLATSRSSSLFCRLKLRHPATLRHASRSGHWPKTLVESAPLSASVFAEDRQNWGCCLLAYGRGRSARVTVWVGLRNAAFVQVEMDDCAGNLRAGFVACARFSSLSHGERSVVNRDFSRCLAVGEAYPSRQKGHRDSARGLAQLGSGCSDRFRRHPS